jgi:hypothetical protein
MVSGAGDILQVLKDDTLTACFHSSFEDGIMLAKSPRPDIRILNTCQRDNEIHALA